MPISRLLCTMTLAALLGSCGAPQGAQGAVDGPAVSQAAPGLDTTATGPLVARVGRGGVTVDEFVERALRNPSAATGELSVEAQREVLDRLVTEEALWQEAVAHGLYRDPKVRKMMVNLLMRQEIYAKVSASDFSPQQLRSYFEEHREDFALPEKVQVKRIFLRIGPTRDREQAMAQAAEIRAQLVEQPDRFKELAVQYSDGPYKRRGGDLGYVSREGKPGIDKSVVDKAFEMKVGQISQPFEAGGGVNLLTVASKRERVERTFEQMKGSVLRRLKNQRYEELTDAYVEQIKDKFDVTVDEEVLASIDLEAARRQRMGAGANAIEGQLDVDEPVDPAGHAPEGAP